MHNSLQNLVIKDDKAKNQKHELKLIQKDDANVDQKLRNIEKEILSLKKDQENKFQKLIEKKEEASK